MPDIADRAILAAQSAAQSAAPVPPPGYTPAQAGGFLLGQIGRVLTPAECAAIPARFRALGLLLGIDWTLAFAESCVETNNYRFTGQVPLKAKNPAGIGAINDGTSYLSYPDWDTGILAFYVHLLAWLDRLDLCRALGVADPAKLDPRLAKVAAARQEKGKATTWRSLGGRWAVKEGVDWRLQAAMKGNYGVAIAARYAAIAETQGGTMATPREATDRYIAALRQRGCAVTDLRGKLPVNPNPAHRYGLVRGGLGGVTKLIQHWTGDAFNRATIAKIVGTDYGLSTISATMSPADEIDLLTWYALFHIGRDGGTWGGIAYGTLVLPSGRVYVAWDIGTLTYHAFSVNGYSYALSTPASNGQAPTPAQLAALNHCWQVLCEETPEIPAGWGDLWGHTEAKRFDPQNQTSCPGPALLAHVQRARGAGAPSVALGAPTPPPDTAAPPAPASAALDAPPAPASAARMIVPGTNAEFWVIEPLLSYYRANGAVARFGWPLSGLFVEDRGEAKGLAVQYFERCRLETQPDGSVTEGRLGAEAWAARG